MTKTWITVFKMLNWMNECVELNFRELKSMSSEGKLRWTKTKVHQAL